MKINKILKFVILGPPGSGKGTISKWLIKDFNLNYVCSGDLLRKEIQNKTDIGNEAKDSLKQGKLVSNELVTNLTFKELKKFLNENWLLDGYPRTIEQTQILTQSFVITKVISLQVPHSEIINRIKNRLVHVSSGRIYNLLFNPPINPMRDDLTDEPLIQREDDKEEVVTLRLKQHDELTKPITDYFKNESLLAEFTGTESKVIYPQIVQYIKNNF